MNDDNTISKYDRQRGSLKDVALFTRPSTIQNVQTLTGRAETFVVATARAEDQGGDFIFVECIDELQAVTRLCLPPRVANAIASRPRPSGSRGNEWSAERCRASCAREHKDRPGAARLPGN